MAEEPKEPTKKPPSFVAEVDELFADLDTSTRGRIFNLLIAHKAKSYRAAAKIVRKMRDAVADENEAYAKGKKDGLTEARNALMVASKEWE